MIRHPLRWLALPVLAGLLLADSPFDVAGPKMLTAPMYIRLDGNNLLSLDPFGALTYTVPTAAASGANGSGISLTAGTAGGGAGLSGNITFTAGAVASGAQAASVGGTASLLGGPDNAAVTSSGGGNVVVQGGSSTVQSNGGGGTALLAGGDTNGGGGSGGATTVRGGDNSGGGSGGALTVRSGGGGGTSGNLLLQTPNQVSGNNNTGTLTISTGNAGNGNTLGTPGDIAITAGNNNAASGVGWNVSGANIKLTTGNGGYQNSNGGDFTVTLGTKAGTGRNGVVKFTSLPTSDPSVAGALWLPSSGAVAVSGTSQTVPLLSGANVWTNQQSVTPTTLSISTATFTPDGTSNNYNITLVHASCPCTLANPSATPVAGTGGQIVVKQSSTGSDTIGTWGSQYEAPGGTSTLTLSTAANAVDILSYYVRDSTHIELSLLTNFSH